MVWGCFARKGVGNLVDIPCTMTKEVYMDILQKNLRESAERLGMRRGLIFQQDNDPKHTAKVVQKYFKDNRVNVLDWPAQSPDLNPIEHLWAELERRIQKRDVRPKNKTELMEALVEEWSQISPDVTAKLVDSMPKRCKAVLQAKGGHTSY